MEKTQMIDGVLANVKECIDISRMSGYHLNIRNVYEYLSIFNWKKETISRRELKAMESFLELAVELGLTGICHFKISPHGFCNEMWAYADRNQPYGSEQAIHCICGFKKYMKKYSFDIGDSVGFCENTYISETDLKKAFMVSKNKREEGKSA